MKKFASLLLALALSLSLCVPALADASYLFVYSGAAGEGFAFDETYSGPGFAYDQKTNTLTLNGLKDGQLEIDFSQRPKNVTSAITIVLAPGSKNSVSDLWIWELNGNEVIIKGSGELEVYNPILTETSTGVKGAFIGGAKNADDLKNIKFQDNLTMTGGVNKGDNGALALAITSEEYGEFQCMAGNVPAQYVRIAPGAPVEPSVTGFTDVANSSPYVDAIKWAVDQNVTKGLTATTFGPGNPCTEKQILTFLYRASVTEKTGGEAEAVQSWAQEKGMDVMHLSSPCTRAIAVVNLWKASGSPEPSQAASFSDVPAGADYAKAVSWAVEKGITSGKTANAFAPNDTCTRGQIVTFLYRAMK